MKSKINKTALTFVTMLVIILTVFALTACSCDKTPPEDTESSGDTEQAEQEPSDDTAQAGQKPSDGTESSSDTEQAEQEPSDDTAQAGQKPSDGTESSSDTEQHDLVVTPSIRDATMTLNGENAFILHFENNNNNEFVVDVSLPSAMTTALSMGSFDTHLTIPANGSYDLVMPFRLATGFKTSCKVLGFVPTKDFVADIAYSLNVGRITYVGPNIPIVQ